MIYFDYVYSTKIGGEVRKGQKINELIRYGSRDKLITVDCNVTLSTIFFLLALIHATINGIVKQHFSTFLYFVFF